jgi:hypothetical protein
VLETLNFDAENRMTARRHHIKFMGCINSILKPCREVLHQFCSIFAFEKKQVLDCKLLIFIPSQPQTLNIRSIHVKSAVIKRRRIQKIIYFFTVDLQKTYRNSVSSRRFALTYFVV